MLFPFATLTSISIFLVGLVYLVLSLFTSSVADVQEYHELMENTNPDTRYPSQTAYTAMQKRLKMQKQIFFEQGSSSNRLEIRIYSASAELVFAHQSDTTSIVEKMHDVRCYIQEELYTVLQNEVPKPMQRMLYLEAANATYDYKNELFIVDEVSLSRFDLPGHQLVESIEGLDPTLSGRAQSAQFSLGGGQLNFKADHFKAIIHSLGDN